MSPYNMKITKRSLGCEEKISLHWSLICLRYLNSPAVWRGQLWVSHRAVGFVGGREAFEA